MIYFVQLTILNIKEFFFTNIKWHNMQIYVQVNKKSFDSIIQKKIVTKLFSKNRKILS